MDQDIFEKKCSVFLKSHCDSANAIKFIVGVFVSDIYPLVLKIAENLQLYDKDPGDYIIKTRNIHLLCTDQIKKCYLTFVELIKKENCINTCLQESRQCTMERILWCYKKLLSINKHLDSPSEIVLNDETLANNSLNLNSMYFVNWVDQTFDILVQLSSIIYNVDNKSEKLYNKWKNGVIEYVSGLHISIDELLLSAMTLSKYCLPTDHVIVKARCQVVLRETKTLLSELVVGADSDFHSTINNLKLPIKPTNVGVLIDVLKDVLYVLETNTNTALLTLLVHCLSFSISPVDMLRNHLNGSKKACTCLGNDEDDVDKCEFVKAFDLHNERLIQIGSFAMSCSSDQKRILVLRSGLASLEALDPHIVPALTISPRGHHASLLVETWRQEVLQIRDNVFLIVDPSAFTEKAKQMMHQTLLEILKQNCYDSRKSCEVINIGALVFEFFSVYNKYEPEALTCTEQLQPLLQDLFKVQMECKIVSNRLCSDNDFKYSSKKSIDTNVSLDKFIKRLKLLHTIVKRIHLLLNPEDNDEFYQEEIIENKTYTVNLETKNGNTYVHSPKVANLTRSVFARTEHVRSPRMFPKAILTRHLKSKQDQSFSIKLDNLGNLSEVKREQSILYHSPLKAKSLRKAVLNRHLTPDFLLNDQKLGADSTTIGSFASENTSLQITDILDQLNDLTISLVTTKRSNGELAHRTDLDREESHGADVSQPSDVDTLERINDLDLVESKLSGLKCGHVETSL